MACEGSPHVFHYSAVEDQYWYRDDQQWYICESQPCPHRHLSFDWTQEEWAGFPAYRKTHPNQSQLIEARLNQPPPAPVARPPRPAVVASRSLPGTQPPSRIPSRVPSRNVTPSESPKLGPSGLPPGLELVRQRLASSPARSPIASTSKLPEAEVKPDVTVFRATFGATSACHYWSSNPSTGLFHFGLSSYLDRLSYLLSYLISFPSGFGRSLTCKQILISKACPEVEGLCTVAM